MRAKLYFGFLVLLIGSLYLTACDNATTGSDNFEESIQLYTDLDPISGASNTTAIINRGENVQANFGKAAGSDSWFQVKLQNIGKNDFINNGTTGAWCLEWKKPLRSNNDVHEGIRLYSTAGSDKWKPLNYFFSIKKELEREDPSLTPTEFQSVVWSLAGYIGIAPEFDLNKLENSELPGRLVVDGQLAVNKEKVISIVDRVKSEYASKYKSTTASGSTIMETEGDEQDVIIPDPPPVIEVDTNIFIYFDASGSMDETLSPLQIMRDTQLKSALLPLYDGNETEYDDRVQVISWCDFTNCERTLDVFNIRGNAPPEDGNIIVLVFQDEARSVYHGSPGFWSINDSRTTTFSNDLTNLRNRLDTFAADFGTNYYRGVLFQVIDDGGFGGPAFKDLFQAVQNGDGSYSGTNGLSDRNEFNYVYDVEDGDTPEAYRDLIIQALQDLGFAI